MKKVITLLAIVFCSGIVGAQVIKTVNVSEPGTFSLTSAERQSVTNLIVTGSIDARDIRYIRKYVANLTSLDLSATTIMAITAIDGTNYGELTTYPANEMPQYSFTLSADMTSSSFTSIILPATITSVGKYAFNGNIRITNITIPPTVTSIKEYAFSGCWGFTGSYFIPNSVADIGAYAFSGTNITAVTIPESVIEIGDNAFASSKLTSITIPASVSKMGKEAFRYCSNLVSATIGSGLERLPSYAFADCYKLTNVELSNGLKTIGDNAFYQCTALTTIKLPTSVTTLENAALWGCSQLSTIYSANSTPPTLTDNSFYGFLPSAIYVPAQSVLAYQQAYGWKSWTYTSSYGDLVTNIFPYTFTSVDKLSMVNSNIVYGHKSAIVVNNISKGQTISVYEVTGKKIRSIISTGASMQIPMNHTGVYLVKINNITQRVIVSN